MRIQRVKASALDILLVCNACKARMRESETYADLDGAAFDSYFCAACACVAYGAPLPDIAQGETA